eukprot:m.237477 g.237477  ORF g.237477 m.237477 type:complete len:80 (+) comp13927_c1_seq23:215-454(+)
MHLLLVGLEVTFEKREYITHFVMICPATISMKMITITISNREGRTRRKLNPVIAGRLKGESRRKVELFFGKRLFEQSKL